MAKITYFLTPSKHPNTAYELTAERNGSGKREIVNYFPEENGRTVAQVTQNAMGRALIHALQSKHDYGNETQLVIEFEICSIIDPLIKL